MWKARHWKPSASYVAVSRVGQQKVPSRGEAMGRAGTRGLGLPGLCGPASLPESCAGRRGRGEGALCALGLLDAPA